MPTKEIVAYQLTAAELTEKERRRAVIAVAAASTDATECTELLAMLGLSPDEALPSVPMPRG